MQKSAIQGFRLSPQQHRLWSLQQAAPASSFRAQLAASLDGPLDYERLSGALAEVIGRHEILRTTFPSFSGITRPVQVVTRAADIKPAALPASDLSGLDAPGQETSVRELFDRELHADFDFERGPLVRASLAKLSAERHLLVLSLPALCADAHSLRGLLAELVGAYGGRPRGGDEPLQYADVAEWQNELVEGEDAKAGRAYWRKQQVGGQERVRLPLWQERAADGSDDESTGVVSVELDAEVCRRVEEAAGRCGTRAEVFLLGCWQVLLWRVSGEPSVTVGAAFDGRNYAELEEVSGPLVRFLPVRSHLQKAMSMAESLTQLDQVMRESYECQEYFTWELFDQTTPSAPGPESFNFCYEYEEWPESYTAAGLTLKHFDSYVCAERADLRLRCVRAGLRLKAEFHYSRQLYSAAEIGYLAEQYAALLEDAVERGDAPVAELKVLSERQCRQLLHDWNDTRADFPTDLCAHHLFERQAARTPYAVAVVCEGKSLSYRELDARADRLARLLRGRSVGAETTVAACFERSLEMVVALLGVLKAGGAYVPLDPAYPRERLSLMLRDSGAAALLTQASLADSLPEFAGPTLCLDSEWGSVLSYEGESPRVSVLAEQLAYVIYTSGSTGAPKGVGVEHRQLVNYVLAASSRLELPESGAYACVSTPAADLGHTMIFPALLRGATLHLLTAECAADPVLLAEYFGRHEIDCLKVVPSHLSALLAGGTAVLPRRRLVLGGEALRSQLVERIRAAAPEGLRLYNHYGPTETAVGVLAGEVCEEEGGGAVALGRAMANTRAYVLDRGLEPVPVGVKGELYIGGAQVSRGYLNRPGLTAERFLPDPYAAEAGARMYRTGDVARYLADGRVEFVGRGDGQVKVRGYRVELGEVEAAARQHPAVSECVVVAREGEAQAGDGAAGEKRLAAYVVAHPHCRADYDGQRRYRLPNGMSVCHRNRDETDLLYREIFADECYLRHGVRLGPGAVVLDVGANVGMFSLFAAARGARLHSFEPIGEVYECLRRNAELARLSADSEIKTYHIGLGASEREETFTYYPRQTVLSGASRHADAAHELEVVKAAMRNEREAGAEGMSALLAEAEAVLGGKFEAREERCRVRRLADVLREDGVGRVDLLKVDVQGAEAEVLAGIEPEQWAGIGQVVVEVHDEEGRGSEGRLEEIRRRLEGLGFRVAVEQERRLAGTDRHDLYAVRDGWWDDERGPAASTGEVRGGLMGVLTAEELRGHLTLLLPDYMVPSHVVLLDALPLTPNGKVDRRALPAPADPRQAAGGGEARTPVEEMLCGLWAEVLGREQVGPEEDFFEAGGHSLLATQVTARVRGRFGVEVRLRSLFERPTPRGLGREVERLLREGAGAEAAPPLVARGGGGGGGGVRAASYAQRRLWFMQQLDEGGAAYNCPGGARLVGELDVAALERALGEVVRRHEALRTSFREEGGEVVQVVSAPEPVALMVRDLSMVERAERERVVEEIAQWQAREGFDLSRGPLLRAELLRVSAEEHVFLLTMHHIVSDGWSMGILIRELGALYEAYRAGAGSPLKELEVQYGDYAEWQRGWMSGEVLRQEVEWWRERLRGGEEVLRLPADRERGVEQRYVGGQVGFEVDAEESEGLRALSRREGCTLFMTLLAAFQTLLCRYTQQETIRVGTPVAGRGQLATEGLIGFFVNTVVMQTELGGNPTFRGLLARVREAALEAYAHQEVPFEKLVEELRPERSLRGTPLFNVWFALRNTPATEIKLKSLTLGEFTSEATTAKFDLGLLMSDTQQRLRGAFEYDSDLFNVGTIEEMVGHFQTLLREVETNPDLPILDIPLLVEEGGERADEVPDHHAADVEAEFSF